MKKFILFFCLSSFSLCAAPQSSAFFEQEQNLIINNRVLLKINGKPISVMDVVRKMDLIFYREYPELASSPVARYQFFTTAWETFLGSVIDDNLIMADAKEKKVDVSEGDIREELERLFGPDVVMNLDKAGMTLDEAVDLLRMELTVQRMNMMMVRSKAIAEVHPKKVREHYEKLLQANPPINQWVYRVLSIRGENHESVAKEAFQLLQEQKLPFEEVVAQLSSSDIELSFSEDFNRDEKSLALSHKAILQTLSAGGISSPVTTDSVSRIFCLKEFKPAEPTPFNDIAEKLKGELIQELSAKYNEEYRVKLRKHYGITNEYLKHVIPNSFEPFVLK